MLRLISTTTTPASVLSTLTLKTPGSVTSKQRSHFQSGQEVAWDSDTTRTWGESWFLNRESGGIEYGWTSSAEFIGRVLDEL